jgi:hypothetical protein
LSREISRELNSLAAAAEVSAATAQTQIAPWGLGCAAEGR